MPDCDVRHAWLDLLDVDGPFLSRPALDESFDRAWPPRLATGVRERVAPADHSRPSDWDGLEDRVNRLLPDVLGYEDGRTIDFSPNVTATHSGHPHATVNVHAIAHAAGRPDEPRMVVLTAREVANRPDQFDPTHRHDDHNWKATPAQRAAKAARHVGADLALVTDGLRHLIVWVGSGTTGSGWVDPSRHRLDRQLADAFVALLHANRITSRVDTTLADVLRLSQQKQAELTGDLGIQVRAAAEALVNAVSRANRDTDGRLLEDTDPHDVYRGIVTVLMRTVFLLNAEERALIGDQDGMWADAYGVSTLLDQLDDAHYRHAGVMRRRHGAWLRLLAAARAVHGGVDHAAMPTYGYGGGLFDPSRFPFLEGVTADGEQLDVGVVDDFTVHHVLDLLQRLDGQRLSYRAFSVEQIGQVYEHLLDHDAVTVPDGRVVLGLVGAKGAEPEVDVAELEAAHSTDDALAKWLADNYDPSSGKTKADKWAARLARPATQQVAGTWQRACRHDSELTARVEAYLGLLDADARGVAKVFLPGDVYVTETSSRRDSGTSYTSPEFAAEIAKHALRHLVYDVELDTDEDPSTGLKTPREILKLKVCDPAVGSGAIIVAAVRYLAERLVDARVEHGELNESARSTAARDSADADPYIQAARDVVAHCIYAVDRDPMAVEMTKLSLWLITMARDRPFSFVDHAIRSGDSLLGVTSLDQLRRMHLGPESPTDFSKDPLLYGAYLEDIDRRITEALDLRAQVRAGDVLGPDDADRRAAISAEADRVLDGLRVVADAITAVCYRTAGKPKKSTDSELVANVMVAALNGERDTLRKTGSSRPPDSSAEFDFFHWALEFPEVLRDGGFVALVGNPPFQGGKKISGASGTSYRGHLIRYCAGEDSGSADLVAYFLRRAADLGLSFGFIATNTVAQGDTRRVGLRALTSATGGAIHRAVSSERWPGRDAVHVAKVWWSKNPPASSVLDGQQVPGIESDLWPVGDLRGEPFRLPKQRQVASVGVYVLGDGFLVDETSRERLTAEDSDAAQFLAPLANGADVSSDPQHRPSRWIIDPGARSREELAAESGSIYQYLEENVYPYRKTVSRKQYRDRWWQYAERRPRLFQRMQRLDRVMVVPKVGNAVAPVWLETSVVPSQNLIVIPWDDYGVMGCLTSTVHRAWVDRYSATFGAGTSYSASDCFDTFPMPGGLRATDRAESDGLGRQLPNGNAMSEVVKVMQSLYEWRSVAMQSKDEGITRFYSRYHSASRTDGVTVELRSRHVELDSSVCRAYGWDDLDLGHGFHETRYGTYFTVSTEARFELLMRLLELNFQQYAEQTGAPLEDVIEKAQQHV